MIGNVVTRALCFDLFQKQLFCASKSRGFEGELNATEQRSRKQFSEEVIDVESAQSRDVQM